MSDALAVEQLYSRVSARFADAGLSALNVFGWREPAQHHVTDRIAWVPGDASGNAGTMAPPRNPGGRPRSIGTLLELFSVLISATDLTALENEQAQYRAVRLLRDAWYAAVFNAAHGTFTIKSEQWLTDKLERRYGATLRIVCELQARIPDGATDDYVAMRDASAELSLELGATTELDVITSPSTGDSGGSSGGNGSLTVYTAGEVISPLRVVRINDDGDLVLVARMPEPESLAPLGIAVQAAQAGATVTVRTAGALSDPSWRWTPGLPVLLGLDGQLTQSQPPGLRYLVVVAYAIDADTIVIRIGPPIRLAD